MATIGYNSLTSVTGETRDTSTPHFILDVNGTYTPTVNQVLVKAGVWVPASPPNPAGQIEIGVYRVDNEARIGTVTVTCGNPGVDTAYEANFAGTITLTAGVEYCYAWRVVADATVMRWDTGSSTGDRNSGVTGATPLQNPFGSTGEGLTSLWAMYVITADSGGSPATISAPTPSGTIGTQTTATAGCTTNQSNGNLYVVASATQAHITGITAAQVVAGQTSSGGVAPFSNSAAVASASPSVGLTGLTGGTLYYYAIAQVTSGGNSNVVTGSFTTASATRSTSITLYDASSNVLASTNLRVWTRVDIEDAAVDGGTTGLSLTTNGSGVLSVTGLSIAAGNGWLTIKDPTDDNNCHNYPVTFS